MWQDAPVEHDAGVFRRGPDAAIRSRVGQVMGESIRPSSKATT